MAEPDLDVRLEHELPERRAIYFLDSLGQKVRGMFSGRVQAQMRRFSSDYVGDFYQPSLIERVSHQANRHFLWWDWSVEYTKTRILVGNCYIARFSDGSHLVLADVDPIIKDQATEHAMAFAKQFGIPNVRIHVAMLKDEELNDH